MTIKFRFKNKRSERAVEREREINANVFDIAQYNFGQLRENERSMVAAAVELRSELLIHCIVALKISRIIS
jgi:hypothetical protein